MGEKNRPMGRELRREKQGITIRGDLPLDHGAKKAPSPEERP